MGVPATWKSDESFVAAELTRVLETEWEYDHVCKRIPLSGSNNRRTDGTPHHGDVSMPDAYDAHIELKRRKSFAHQRLFDDAKADAAKHGISHTILITKQLRQRGFTVLLESDLFFEILAVPGVREILKRGNRNSANPPKPGNKPGSPAKRQRKARPEEDHADLGSNSAEDKGRPL